VAALRSHLKLATPTSKATAPAISGSAHRGGARLNLEGVNKHFGGIAAISCVSLDIPAGSIYGLIGPNGAGKTTLFNLITGAYKPDSGKILLDGELISGFRPHVIARSGVSRTFQNIRLFRQMTVYENLKAGQFGTSSALMHLTTASRQRESALNNRADYLLHLLGLTAMRDRIAVELPYATQRRVEVARALAQQPRLLLLDEPTAGMDSNESAEISDIIRLVHREFRCTVLLIEHDMSVVMGVCHAIAVLNFGRVIAVGTPRQIQANTDVHNAYLGGESVA
jgi:branched-chain amino acid transport system ATP-binding protein